MIGKYVEIWKFGKYVEICGAKRDSNSKWISNREVGKTWLHSLYYLGTR